MKAYIDLLDRVIRNGEWKSNRTGIDTIGVIGEVIKHDMRTGFPLVTARRIPWQKSMVETEGFLKGITDKAWYREQGCGIWDEWCNRESEEYLEILGIVRAENPLLDTNSLCKEAAKRTADLGPIYGYQWRHFDAPYDSEIKGPTCDDEVDQLQNMVDTLKTAPTSRQNIVCAWNPKQLEQMALPPCHVLFRVSSPDGKMLDLTWYQRSVDVVLGLPFNICSYATILTLLGETTGLQPRYLTGLLDDTHVYKNHLSGATDMLTRESRALPSFRITMEKNIFNWQWSDVLLTEYNPHPGIKFEVAV